MNTTHQMNQDTTSPVDRKLEDLYGLIKGIKVCMMTTRKTDGSLVSRAMMPRDPNPKVAADLWFFSNNDSQKHEELNQDPHVNLSFYNPQTGEWVSVSGLAREINNREKIRELYQTDIRAWLGDLNDGIHDGGPNDPRLSLIFVEAQTVHYSLQDVPTAVKYFNIVRGMVTAEPPKISAERGLSKQELDVARRAGKVEE